MICPSVPTLRLGDYFLQLQPWQIQLLPDHIYLAGGGVVGAAQQLHVL